LQELVFVFVSEFLSKTFCKKLFSEIIFLPWISTFFQRVLEKCVSKFFKNDFQKFFKNYFQQQSLKIVFWKNSKNSQNFKSYFQKLKKL